MRQHAVAETGARLHGSQLAFMRDRFCLLNSRMHVQNFYGYKSKAPLLLLTILTRVFFADGCRTAQKK